MRKFPIGSRVLVVSQGEPTKCAVVLRHGRDTLGIYTEVKYDDGQIERVHRSMLRKEN